jgi:hypothetical protein
LSESGVREILLYGYPFLVVKVRADKQRVERALRGLYERGGCQGLRSC